MAPKIKMGNSKVSLHCGCTSNREMPFSKDINCWKIDYRYEDEKCGTCGYFPWYLLPNQMGHGRSITARKQYKEAMKWMNE